MPAVTDDEIFEVVRSAVGPDLPPVASLGAVAEVEEVIGYPLPPLLRRLYLQVANGGFGPQGGIIGVSGYDYWSSDVFADITESAMAFRAEPNGRRQGMVQLLDWGCSIASLLDCRDPAGALWGWDPNRCCWDHALFPQHIAFSQWLAESIGRDYSEPFYDGYLESSSGEDTGSVELIALDADNPVDEEGPCHWSPPVWANGREVGIWGHLPGAGQ
jgi:hypothetical protein